MWLEVRSPALWVKAGWLPAVLSGRLVGDIGEEAFNPHLEIGVWTQLKAGAGDMDLEGGHIEATADTIRADDLSEGESERRKLRLIWGRHSVQYQISKIPQQFIPPLLPPWHLYVCSLRLSLFLLCK